MLDKINEYIELQEPIHIRKAIEPFGWDVVVKHLQQCADGEYYGTPNGTLSYQLNEAEEIEDVKRVIDYLNKELSLKIFDAHMFVAFTKEAKGSKHIDNHNVLIWAITDNMLVHLYSKDEDEPYYTEELKKGDMIFVPQDVQHRIESTGARALVSFGIEVEPGVKYNSPIDNPYIKVNNNNEN